jgi:hypothetical protein
MLSPDEEGDWNPAIYMMEINDLVNEGDRIRLENRRELLSLRSNLAPLIKSYNEKKEVSDQSVYQEIIKESFKDEKVTSYVRKIQSLLCHTLHTQEVEMNQIKIAQRYNKQLIVYLSKEIRNLKNESLRREEMLKEDAIKIKNTIEPIRQMREEDARDQEEEIICLKEKLGIDTTKRRSSRFSTPRKNLRKLSGSLRNIMTKSNLIETPGVLKESKIWNDLKEREQEDASEMSQIQKRRRRFLGRLRRPHLPKAASQSDNDSHNDERDEMMPRSNASTPDEKSKERGSIISAVFGGWDELSADSEMFDPRRSHQSSETPETSRVKTKSTDLMTGEMTPTSEAYEKLSLEVFNMDLLSSLKD